MCSQSWIIPYNYLCEFVLPMIKINCRTFSGKAIVGFFEYYHDHQSTYPEKYQLTKSEFHDIMWFLLQLTPPHSWAYLSDLGALETNSYFTKKAVTERTLFMVKIIPEFLDKMILDPVLDYQGYKD